MLYGFIRIDFKLEGFEPFRQVLHHALLISELAQQETDLIKPEQAYPVWSPYGADEAADTMLKV